MSTTLFNDTGAETRGAKLSECRTYRYALWRDWDWQGYANRVMFIGLNPSTADETKNDLTISKCIGFAKRWGFGGIEMLNLYAFRATYPEDMVAAADPLGPGNLEAFGYHRSRVGLIVACWGSITTRHRPYLKWQSTISSVLASIAGPVYCLGKTADGSPRHPSRLGYDTKRELFWSPRSE
jgi:hypothetical protein